MGGQMEFRNKVLQGELVFGNTKFWGVICNPLEQLDRPAASNIVGNLDHFNLFVFHRGKEDVVHVYEPNRISVR